MAHALTVRRIGNSLGLILPKPVLDMLGVRAGEKLFAVRTAEGIRLTAYDPDFAAVVESTRDYMHRHRNALRELAER